METYVAELVLSSLSKVTKETMHCLLGRLELLSQDEPTPWQREQLEASIASADRLLRITADFCSLAHQPDIPRQQTLQPVVPAKMAERLNLVLQPLAREKNLHLELVLNPELAESGAGYADPMEEILLRLTIDCIRRGSEGNVVIFISDAGASKIRFEVHAQAKGVGGAEAPAEGGVVDGPLGDSLLRRLCQDIGGTVEFTEREHNRVRIVMEAPFEPGVAVASSRGEELMAHAECFPPKNLSILVAEDNDDSFFLFEEYLRGTGHKVNRVTNGIDAVEMVTTRPHDLVMMDINMPRMDGYAATRAIRDWETANSLRRTPILVLSAESLEDQRRFGAMNGCSGYLTKPISQSGLLNAIGQFTKAS